VPEKKFQVAIYFFFLLK